MWKPREVNDNLPDRRPIHVPGGLMPINSLLAAKRICQLREWQASNLEIQKTLYIAHMISLGRTGGQRGLVAEDFQAWDFGPVLPNVYHRAKDFGNSPVMKGAFIAIGEISADDDVLLRDTVDSLKGKTPGELVAITHWDKGAWAAFYRPGQKNIVIPNNAIYDEYRLRTTGQ